GALNLRSPMHKLSAVPLLLLFLVPVLTAQSSPDKPSQQQRQPSPRADQQDKPPEHKITPEEAKELFQSVDEILQFASKSTLLPMKQPVKKAMVSREQVEKYIEEKFKDDVDRIRFERSELVLKKFGFLPRTFDLHTFM